MAQGNVSANSNENLLQNLPIGYLMAILSLIYIILYIPCAIVLWRLAQLNNSCHKIMAFMAVADILNLFTGGTLTGFVSIVGTSEAFLTSYTNKVCVVKKEWRFSALNP